MRALLALTLAAAAHAQITGKQLLEPPAKDWLHYNGQFHSQRHSPLTQVNRATVKGLTAQWIFGIPGARQLQTVPIVVDGVMYVSAPNEIYALDARTGRLVWDYHRSSAIAKGPNRGVAVYGNKVYMTTPDAFLIAVDARNGSLLWEKEIMKASDGYWSPAAPLVVPPTTPNGPARVIAGMAPSDHGLNGGLDAYDAETGERLWRWNSIPAPGEPGHETWSGDSWKTGGGGTWLTGSYDPELKLLYWGLGNPAPDFDGDVRKGDNLYTECIVALDVETGKMRWFFQNTPHDVHDWDSVEVPILVDADFRGRKRKLIVQANRNGFYYVLDRESGEFLHGTPFVQKLNWASGLDDKGRPIRVPGIVPSFQGTKTCPATSGATNWMSPAYNPDTGFFYVVAQEGCGINTKSRDTFRPGGFSYMATGYIESPADPWQMYVRALDVTTGKVQWEYKQVSSRRYGAGVMSTAGGLVFAADDQGFLTALDAKSGEALWHFNTGQPIKSQPISFAIGGRQYIAIAAGTNVVAFALPR
ncbi:MAG: PQQ-binding-like beta-propeller repeat protein [Bryobacteraceae bacterium]